jgi:hypothetical protein
VWNHGLYVGQPLLSGNTVFLLGIWVPHSKRHKRVVAFRFTRTCLLEALRLASAPERQHFDGALFRFQCFLNPAYFSPQGFEFTVQNGP